MRTYHNNGGNVNALGGRVALGRVILRLGSESTLLRIAALWGPVVSSLGIGIALLLRWVALLLRWVALLLRWVALV